MCGAPGRAIILIHDAGGADRSQTIAALPDIIGGLRSAGSTLAPLPAGVWAGPTGAPLAWIGAGQNRPVTFFVTPDQRCFLDFAERSRERAIETALTERLQDTLAELGPGFAFVGRQVAFTVDGDEFFVDLLLFHAEQVRYVVVELKVGKFRRVRWAARLLRHHGR